MLNENLLLDIYQREYLEQILEICNNYIYSSYKGNFILSLKLI